MLKGLNVDAHLDKRVQWQKKPNNMKKESSKVKTIGAKWQE